MRSNISHNVGNLILMDKVDKQYNFFGWIFQGLKGKTKHLLQSAKAFINNRLDKCVSINQITEIYPKELFYEIGFKESPKKRTLYRDLERIGIRYSLITEKYQQLLKKNNLISEIQFPDFSSSYFEGDKAELGALGYSRDGKPRKKQMNFGIQVGENKLPTALKSKGNVESVSRYMRYADIDFRCYSRNIEEFYQLVSEIKDNFLQNIIEIDSMPIFKWKKISCYSR